LALCDSLEQIYVSHSSALTYIRWGRKWVHLTQFHCLGHLSAKNYHSLWKFVKSDDKNNFDCFFKHGVQSSHRWPMGSSSTACRLVVKLVGLCTFYNHYR